jgi:formamidopyrimidine-DNA glycosylase
MSKPRIPLPKKTEKVHKDRTKYDRDRQKIEHGRDSSLEVFLMTDQPETCRYCGSRTNFVQVGKRQLHTCPECGKQYWVEE